MKKVAVLECLHMVEITKAEGRQIASGVMQYMPCPDCRDTKKIRSQRAQ